MVTILLFGLIAASAEVLGGMLVVLRKEWPAKVQEYLLALGAGFLLALVFFELLPESIALLGGAASLWMMAGFGLLHFFEHTIVGHLHFGEETHAEAVVSPVAVISAVGGLGVHALFDGIAIAAGMQFDFTIGLLVFFAILLHKLPEGLTIASIVLAAGRPKRHAAAASLAIGAATLIGVVTVLFLTRIDARAVGGAFAFSAGAAVYVGASDLVPEINRSGNRITPLIVFAGMLLFYLGKVALEGLVAR